MNTIGERLREERMRLGLAQEEFAATGGVQRRAQGNYEREDRHPDAGYLAKVAAVGADVLYIVTGIRAVTEQQLIDDLRRYGDAWETLELALAQAKKTLTPSQKRKAVDAIYKASKAQVSGVSDMTALAMAMAA